MRLGLVIETAQRRAPLQSVVAQAQALERVGMELALCPDGEPAGPPLLTLAALSVHTRALRLLAEVMIGPHPLRIAEGAVVADNCSGGRVSLVLHDPVGDRELMDETVSLLLAALAARPFRHRGARWQAPANIPENEGTEERITITPRSAQLEMPVWLMGGCASELSGSFGLSAVIDDLEVEPASGVWEGVSRALGKVASRLTRPGVWSIDADRSGDFDDQALVERLSAHRSAWGLDAAILRLPADLDDVARERVARRLATTVRPRVTEDRLPPGLEEYWRTTAPELLAAAGLEPLRP